MTIFYITLVAGLLSSFGTHTICYVPLTVFSTHRALAMLATNLTMLTVQSSASLRGVCRCGVLSVPSSALTL
jgi:hypothetical protein